MALCYECYEADVVLLGNKQPDGTARLAAYVHQGTKPWERFGKMRHMEPEVYAHSVLVQRAMEHDKPQPSRTRARANVMADIERGFVAPYALRYLGEGVNLADCMQYELGETLEAKETQSIGDHTDSRPKFDGEFILQEDGSPVYSATGPGLEMDFWTMPITSKIGKWCPIKKKYLVETGGWKDHGLNPLAVLAPNTILRWDMVDDHRCKHFATFRAGRRMMHPRPQDNKRRVIVYRDMKVINKQTGELTSRRYRHAAPHQCLPEEWELEEQRLGREQERQQRASRAVAARASVQQTVRKLLKRKGKPKHSLRESALKRKGSGGDVMNRRRSKRDKQVASKGK